jgi:hypothetical protein
VTVAKYSSRHFFRFRGRNFLALAVKPEMPLADWLADLDQWLKGSARAAMSRERSGRAA